MLEAGIVDLQGEIRSRSFLTTIDEFGFDGFCVGLASIEDSDLIARPEATRWLYRLNGESAEFRFCRIYKGDKPYPLDVRLALLKYIRQYPYDVRIGPEIEFYIKEGEHKNNESYMLPYPFDADKLLVRSFAKELNRLGYGVKLEHSEAGQGQHEIAIAPAEPLEIADKIVFFRYYARMFFAEKGKTVLFDPKPFKGLSGSGMHLHISLRKDGKEISFLQEGKSFLAGILEHIKEITIFLNPAKESYERLNPGYEAPVYISWGIGNRSTLIRIPSYRKIEEHRLELRSPDPLMNPYLGFIAILEAGLDGIRQGMEPPAPIQKNVYELDGLERLPSSLEEALAEAKKSKLLKELPEDIRIVFDSYLKLKEKEVSRK